MSSAAPQSHRVATRCMTSVAERKRRNLKGLWKKHGEKVARPEGSIPFGEVSESRFRDLYRNGEKKGAVVPRAHVDTKYTILRREFKEQMKATRKAYAAEYESQVDQLHKMESDLQKRVEQRRLKKKEKKAKQIAAKEEQRAAAVMRDAVNETELKEDKRSNAISVLQQTERAKSLYALGLLEKESKTWVVDENTISEEIFSSTNEPVGFTPGNDDFYHPDSVLEASTSTQEVDDLVDDLVDAYETKEESK